MLPSEGSSDFFVLVLCFLRKVILLSLCWYYVSVRRVVCFLCAGIMFLSEGSSAIVVMVLCFHCPSAFLVLEENGLRVNLVRDIC